LWQALSSTFHKAFGYGEGSETREAMIQRGPYGLDGFLRFAQYFVVERGMDNVMFELKLEQVLEALDSVLVFSFLSTFSY
jgi:hypothetical protein